MTSYLLAGPASEPISLAEAKAYLRLDGAAEDGLVATLIAAARMHVESVTAQALLLQHWRLVLDAWPQSGWVVLPLTPIHALEAITAHDEAGDPTELDLAQFVREGNRLRVPRQVAGMPRLQEHFGIEIDFWAGYGASPSDVPAPLRQAVLILVGHWFENRDAVIVAGSGSVLPFGFDRLISPFREVRL